MQLPAAIAQRRRLLFAALALLLSGGCAQPATEEGDILASNDFDHLDGWVGDAPSLTRDQAHSGNYSLVVQPGTPYSLGYSNPLSRLSLARPQRLRIGAWVRRTSPQSAATLVVELKDPGSGTSLIWEGINLRKEAPRLNEWQHISYMIVVPMSASAVSRIGVYMWDAKSNPATYLDDLTISLVPE